MREISPQSPEVQENKPDIQTEQQYIDTCVDYALRTGWVKEDKKPVLIERYLKPIYRKYLEVIDDLRKEGVSEADLVKIVQRMNACLEATRRIGSTDASNIVRTIEDLRSRARDNFTEYALAALLEQVSEVLGWG